MLSHLWTQSIWDGKGWKPFSTLTPVLLFASGDLRLLQFLQGWCARKRVPLYLSKPDSEDLILTPYFAAVIDRHYVGKSAWEHFCQYRQLAQIPVPPELEEEFPDLADGEEPLVIVLDAPGLAIGEINPLNLFFLPPSHHEEILPLLEARGKMPNGVSRGDQYPFRS